MTMERNEIVELLEGEIWSRYVELHAYDVGEAPSSEAADALDDAHRNMLHESARIVEADQAGKLDEYLAAKERAR